MPQENDLVASRKSEEREIGSVMSSEGLILKGISTFAKPWGNMEVFDSPNMNTAQSSARSAYSSKY